MENAIETRKAIENNKLPFLPKGYYLNTLKGAAVCYSRDYKKNGEEYVVAIAVSHNSNKYFNTIVRTQLYGNNPNKIEKGDWMLITRSWNRNGISLFAGDQVKVLEVDWSSQIFESGMYFAPIKIKAKNIKGEEITISDWVNLDCIDFPNGWNLVEKEKELIKSRYKKNTHLRESNKISDDRYLGALRMTYGHAITCNKAQGGEWEKVYMSTFKMPSLKYQYTALTRAKNEIVFIR